MTEGNRGNREARLRFLCELLFEIQTGLEKEDDADDSLTIFYTDSHSSVCSFELMRAREAPAATNRRSWTCGPVSSTSTLPNFRLTFFLTQYQ